MIIVSKQNCESGKPIIKYDVCNYHGLYDRAGRDMRNFVLRDGATVVPAGHVLVWPGTSFAQHMGISLPAWSLNDRPKKDVFAEWIFDAKTQCGMSDMDNAVCTNVNDNETPCTNQGSYDDSNSCKPFRGQKVAVQPWLGGSFNPWFGCDTTVPSYAPNGETIGETINYPCNENICGGNHTEYYDSMPNRNYCSLYDNTVVSKKNVNQKATSNLCTKMPTTLPTECLWEQGQAMQTTPGKQVTSLYEDYDPVFATDRLREQGQGLFVHGGNPLYYTSKNPDIQAELTHAILKQSSEVFSQFPNCS